MTKTSPPIDAVTPDRDRVGTEARPNCSFFQIFDIRRQSTGFERQRQIVCRLF